MVAPAYSGADAALVMGDGRYARFGSTLGEIVWHVLSHPVSVIGAMLLGASLAYVATLATPIAWGLSPLHLAPLLGAVPQLALNLLSSSSLQRSLAYQYQLPIAPFLVISALSAMVADRAWLRKGRWILAWCLVAFVALSGVRPFVRDLFPLRTRPAMRAALARLPPEAAVLTDNCIGPQISRRARLYVLHGATPVASVPDVDFALFDTRRPCHIEVAALSDAIAELRRSRKLRTVSDDRGVVLLARGFE